MTQRRRQDLPVLCKRPLDRMELQSLGPYFLTWFIRTSSSSAFHGPFLIPSSLFPSISQNYSFFSQLLPCTSMAIVPFNKGSLFFSIFLEDLRLSFYKFGLHPWFFFAQSSYSYGGYSHNPPLNTPTHPIFSLLRKR